MRKIFSKDNLTKFILIFYVLSIFLDLHIFYNSFSTLLRVGVISIFFLIIFIKYSTNKEKKMFLFYFIALGIYIILHLINANNFSTSVPTVFNNLSELLYFYKMIMNVFIIYIVYKLGIDSKKFSKVLKISLWFICGSIVLTNILKIGYSTYNFKPIQDNIFMWFTSKNNNYTEISGKGYFHLGNQIIAIILLYLPLLINEIKTKLLKSDVILLGITLLSMLILGNRLSTVGSLIILLLAFLIHLFLILIKQEKFNSKFFIIILITIIIYNIFLFYSPLLHRTTYKENRIINSESKLEEKGSDKIVNNDIMKQLKTKLVNMNFPTIYYPYENDPEFWEHIATKSPTALSNTRYIEISVIKRVKDLNDNSLDDWFGIGYDRVINIFNIERDYVMQYYSIGIIGSILLLTVYFLIYIYSAFKLLINLEYKFTFKILMLFIGIGFFLVAAYFSGNILNAISTILPLSFVLGILLNEVIKNESNNNHILGYKMPLLSKEELITNLNLSIKDNKQAIIFNLNPIIMMNFYKDYKIKQEFNDSSFNIPDGIGTIYASKMKDINLTTRIAGVDFFDDICKLCNVNNLKVFLYGGKEGIARKVKKTLNKKYPKIKVVGALNGYLDDQEVLEQIKKAEPNVLFIALGTPLQENFIVNNKKELSKLKIIMPVGGTFDVISGSVKRAPDKIIKLNLEWVYRMIIEPRRILINLKVFKYLFLVIFRNNCYNIGETKESQNDK